MKPNPELIDEENPEWTDDNLKNSVPISGLPTELQATLRQIQRRGTQKAPRKVSTTVRLDAEVLAAFKATGKGWQTRMNDVLKDALRNR
jgi:uncharacterized protein (DUF4415 family)